MTAEQFDKLPKWAQQEFKQLEHENVRLIEANTALSNAQTPSRVSYKPTFDFTDDNQRIFIKDNTTIRVDTSIDGERKTAIDIELCEMVVRGVKTLGIKLRGEYSLGVVSGCSNVLNIFDQY